MVVLQLLIACAFITSTEKEERRDQDGDGFPSIQFGGVDCDDRDPDVNPEALEICNGVDDDCNGEIDDGDDRTAWYLDSDDDSFGDEATLRLACTPEEGEVSVAGDCDDTLNEVNPDAAEACTGRDDDCDTLVDTDDPDLPEQTVYADTDGDGFGDPGVAVSIATCDAPSGFVFDDQDCDDADPAINPDATEVCEGVDEDCDGLEGDDDPDTDRPTWYPDLDDDGYGDPAQGIEACAPPGGHVSDDQDCDDADASTFPGADEYCDGLDQDCDGEADDNAIDVGLYYEDVDGDGYGDAGSTRTGCDAPSGYVDDDQDCDDGDSSAYPGAEEECGSTVDSNCDGSVGDVDSDGDGYQACEDCDDTDSDVNPDGDEVCNGVDDDCDGLTDDDDSSVDSSTQSLWYADSDGDGYGDSGSASLACEQPSATVTDASDCDDGDSAISPYAYEVCNDSVDEDCSGSTSDCAVSMTDADMRIRGVTSGDQAGASVATGDLDGDGNADLVVGAPGKGSVYVAYGPLSAGNLSSAEELTAVYSTSESGASVSVADNDADGVDDIVTGAPGEDGVYIALGPVSSGSLGAVDAEVFGDSGGDAFGHAVSWFNHDGDGYADLLISAPDEGETLSANRGEVYLFVDSLSGTYSTADATATIQGDGGDAMGLALIGADLDGDGDDEIVIGGYANSTLGQGGVYVFDGASGALGSGDADMSFTAAIYEESGDALASGDFDGDGAIDLVVGGSAASSGRGLVYVLSAPSSGGTLASKASLEIEGASGDAAGTALTLADLDGDGTDDLVVVGATESWLFLGGSTGSVSVSDAELQFTGLGSGASVDARADGDGAGSIDLMLGDADGAGAVYLFAGEHLSP